MHQRITDVKHRNGVTREYIQKIDENMWTNLPKEKKKITRTTMNTTARNGDSDQSMLRA